VLKAQGVELRDAPRIGFNPNHASALNFCPLTGGQPAQDFVVKLRRV
jgi:hypothetical protein